MRIHGVSPDYVRDLKALGYDHVPIDKLVEMRIHGVTPDYIREVQQRGFKNVSIDDLIEMRIHGFPRKASM